MSRRKHMAGAADSGVVPAELTAAGVTAGLWDDPVAVDRWCERRGLPLPPQIFWTSPRALRDHAAVAWSVKEWPSRFPGIPDWAATKRAGVGPVSGARMKARREAI